MEKRLYFYSTPNSRSNTVRAQLESRKIPFTEYGRLDGWLGEMKLVLVVDGAEIGEYKDVESAQSGWESATTPTPKDELFYLAHKDNPVPIGRLLQLVAQKLLGEF